GTLAARASDQARRRGESRTARRGLGGTRVNFVYLVALLSSVFYGGADFYGGLAARRVNAMVAPFVATLAGLPVVILGLWIFRAHPLPADYAWGAAAGVSGGAAAAFIFYAIAIGPVSVASPVLALTGMT